MGTFAYVFYRERKKKNSSRYPYRGSNEQREGGPPCKGPRACKKEKRFANIQYPPLWPSKNGGVESHRSVKKPFKDGGRGVLG